MRVPAASTSSEVVDAVSVTSKAIRIRPATRLPTSSSSIEAAWRSLASSIVAAPALSRTARALNLTLNQGQGEICFDLHVADIEAPTRAHIHRPAAGVNGPIVVTFFDR